MLYHYAEYRVLFIVMQCRYAERHGASTTTVAGIFSNATLTV
jgi:hypothetical protein